MRIFTKKSFKFRFGGKTVTTNALSFANVPEWVAKDPIFNLAVEEGSIEIVNGKTDEKLIETTGTKQPEIPAGHEKTVNPADSDTLGSGGLGQSGGTFDIDTELQGNAFPDEPEIPAGHEDIGSKKKIK